MNSLFAYLKSLVVKGLLANHTPPQPVTAARALVPLPPPLVLPTGYGAVSSTPPTKEDPRMALKFAAIGTQIEDLCTGKIKFSGFEGDLRDDFADLISRAPASVQPVINAGLHDVLVAGSMLAGAGVTELGPMIAPTLADAETFALNAIEAVLPAIPGNGALAAPERAVIQFLFAALKSRRPSRPPLR